MADEATPPDGTSALSAVLAQMRDLLGLKDAPGLARLSLEALQQRTRRQLLAWARPLGLTGLHRLTKEALASRLGDALARLGVTLAGPAQEPSRPVRPQKFDLGQPPERALPEHIPWGYARDRVTAMVIDPDRLYVYWEGTDDGIARARAGLGSGGAGAWLNLRVYDVTGRIFDGTNAHTYLDHTIARDDRQWFFTVGKPTSTAVAEVGMKSAEGYFVRLARSGRADFPRRGPAAPGPIDWLTVRTAAGPVEPPLSGTPPVAGPAAGVPPAAATLPAHFEWRSPVLHTSWETGPFAAPVESPAYVEEHHAGTVTVVARNGRTHVVYGPWQVVIRNLGAWAERRVVATWEMTCTWTSAGNHAPLPAGGGAHAVFLVGASEVLYAGASERGLPGASEHRLGGSGERPSGR